MESNNLELESPWAITDPTSTVLTGKENEVQRVPFLGSHSEALARPGSEPMESVPSTALPCPFALKIFLFKKEHTTKTRSSSTFALGCDKKFPALLPNLDPFPRLHAAGLQQ